MGVQINETWGYDRSTRIDFSDGSTADFTDRYNRIAFHTDVCFEFRRACAIDDHTVSDYEIKQYHSSR